MKIALGTAQFGLDYGISNNNGQVNESIASEILAFAQTHKIDTLDTAIAYGKSEQVIGNICEHSQHSYKIITKLASLSSDYITQIKGSKKRLKTDKLYAVMLHNVDCLLSEERSQNYQKLLKLKSEKHCKKIGVSVYSPQQLMSIIDNFEIDIVQIPLNIFDQRFAQNGIPELLKEKDIEVHARSLFLQGLLLMDINNIPTYFDDYKESFAQLTNYCKSYTLTKLEACLSFAKSMHFVDNFVIGVSTQLELMEITQAYTNVSAIDFSGFSLTNELLINPTYWPDKKVK